LDSFFFFRFFLRQVASVVPILSYFGSARSPISSPPLVFSPPFFFYLSTSLSSFFFHTPSPLLSQHRKNGFPFSAPLLPILTSFFSYSMQTCVFTRGPSPICVFPPHFLTPMSSPPLISVPPHPRFLVRKRHPPPLLQTDRGGPLLFFPDQVLLSADHC